MFLRPIVSGSHLFAAGMLGELRSAIIPGDDSLTVSAFSASLLRQRIHVHVSLERFFVVMGFSAAPCIWQPLVRCLAGVLVCGFPFSASFGSTVDTGLCQSTKVSLGNGLCFATETGTHRATCATSCLDKDVDMPVVVLDRCPVSTCRKLWSPAFAVHRSGRVDSVWQQRQVRTVQLCSRELLWVVSSGQLRGSFWGPAHRCRAEGVMSTGTWLSIIGCISWAYMDRHMRQTHRQNHHHQHQHQHQHHHQHHLVGSEIVGRLVCRGHRWSDPPVPPQEEPFPEEGGGGEEEDTAGDVAVPAAWPARWCCLFGPLGEEEEEEEEQEKAPEGSSSLLWTSLCPSATSSSSRKCAQIQFIFDLWTFLLCSRDRYPQCSSQSWCSSWARSLCPCCATTGAWFDGAENCGVPAVSFHRRSSTFPFVPQKQILMVESIQRIIEIPAVVARFSVVDVPAVFVVQTLSCRRGEDRVSSFCRQAQMIGIMAEYGSKGQLCRDTAVLGWFCW